MPLKLRLYDSMNSIIIIIIIIIINVCCFYGNWVEHVCACQLGVLGNLVLWRLMSRRPWTGVDTVSAMCDSA